MRLIIDIGNTLAKVALFEDSSLIEQIFLPHLTVEVLKLFLKDKPKPESAILSSVRQSDPALVEYLSNNHPFILLTSTTPLPIKNSYATPASLGLDRLAAAVAASMLFPNRNVLIISAGTAITYDIVTGEGEYLGGAIAPGLQMRLRALHQFTDKLPMVELSDKAKLIGSTTEESILSGVLIASRAEIDGMIDNFNKHYDQLEIILSGGDVNYFDKSLKNSIFAIPNIVISGLNQLLAYNFGKKNF